MPDTYYYLHGDSASSIIKKAASANDKYIEDQWQKRDLSNSDVIKTKEEAIILASMIEKETSIDSERSYIASVFINRLRKNMRLQSCPTAIYSIKNGYTFAYKLSHADLRYPSEYNTYKRRGLPPSAICNPSKGSIRAALHPAKTDMLYFVVGSDGRHMFAKTFEEHKDNCRIN